MKRCLILVAALLLVFALLVWWFSPTQVVKRRSSSLLELVDYLVAERSAVCTVVLPNDGPLVELLNDKGAATLQVDFGWWCAGDRATDQDARRQMAVGCSRILQLVPTLERTDPDVIVSNTLVIPWGALAAAKLGIPHVWWIHEFGEMDHGLKFFLDFRKTLNIIAESASHIILNSEVYFCPRFGGTCIPASTILASGNFARTLSIIFWRF